MERADWLRRCYCGKLAPEERASADLPMENRLLQHSFLSDCFVEFFWNTSINGLSDESQFIPPGSREVPFF